MTRLLSATPRDVAEAAALLRAGGLVAFGTETVYGLGARADDDAAVAAIYRAKGRPSFNPLICHYTSIEAAGRDVHLTDLACRLATAFWPGPLTLVLPRRADGIVCRRAGGSVATLAIRVPNHPVALDLLRETGLPVAAPSANRSGRVSPTTAAHVLEGLGGRIDAVLDCGPCALGLESTVLDLSVAPPALLRLGGIEQSRIEGLIGCLGRASDPATAPHSPGQLAAHYAPTLPLRLDAADVAPDEALLAFGPHPPAGLVYQLSHTADLAEAASRLFAGLRSLDTEAGALGLAGIAAMSVPSCGLGAAINDRLRRAAHRA